MEQAFKRAGRKAGNKGSELCNGATENG
ncbi:hypothetical protein [Pediococcus acidilactici]|nr:hypothetical protein [Pediococcus acidilactici]